MTPSVWADDAPCFAMKLIICVRFMAPVMLAADVDFIPA